MTADPEPLVEEGLALLAAELGVGVAEHVADGGEEVALAGPVPADDDVGARGENGSMTVWSL